MEMTRLRTKSLTNGSKARAVPERIPEESQEMRGKKKANGRVSKKEDKSLVKLNSSDDLLGRRMQGLVGGLTGLGEDE